MALELNKLTKDVNALGQNLAERLAALAEQLPAAQTALVGIGVADEALGSGGRGRLGSRGLIDANIGLTKLINPISSSIGLNGSLRGGLLLGGPSALEQLPARLEAADDAALRPRYYAGAQLGSYNYVVRFSDFDPYAARPGGIPAFFQRPGVGTYSIEDKNPYFYVGYQLQPRLALPLGYQGQAGNYL